MFKKTLATALAALVFATQSGLSQAAEANLWADHRRAVQRIDSEAKPVPAFPSSVSAEDPLTQVAVAAQLEGARLSVRSSGAAAPLALLIQDVHGNPEAQAGARAILERLVATGLLTTVALEGCFRRADISAFTRFPDKASLRKAIDYLVSTGDLPGATAAALGSARPVALVGIDDKALYDSNVAAYLDSRASRTAVRDALDAARAALDREPISPALKRFDHDVRAYHGGAVPLGTYLDELAVAAGHSTIAVDIFRRALILEQRIDSKAVEIERDELLARLGRRVDVPAARDLLADTLAFRAGRLDGPTFYRHLRAALDKAGLTPDRSSAFARYLAYLEAADAVDADRLFADMASLETAAYGRLARDAAAQRWATRSRFLTFASKLIDFTLSPSEWASYQQIRDKERALRPLPATLRTFEAFYEAADARNVRLAENLLHAGAGHFVAAVAGGYHADALAVRLKAAGWTVAVLTPRLTHADLAGASSYLSAFAQRKTPLEKLFTPERLFVAPDPLAPAAKLPSLTAGIRAHEHRSASPADDVRALAPRVPIDSVAVRPDGSKEIVEVKGDGRTTDTTITFNDADRVESVVESVASAREPNNDQVVPTRQKMPGQESEAQAPAVPAQAAPTIEMPRTILYVDDERAMRQATSLLLQAFGFRVLQASTGEEALQLIKDHAGQIDLVLTDFELPDYSGLDIYNHVRSEPSTAHLPVVVITAHSRESLDAGGLPPEVPFVQKPFFPDALKNTLIAAIGGSVTKRVPMPQSWFGSRGPWWFSGLVMPLIEEALRQAAGQLLPGGPLTIIVLYSVVHALLHVVVDLREGGWKLFLRRLPARVALSAAFGAASWYGPRLFGLDAGAVVSIAGMEIPGLAPFLFGFGAHALNNLVLVPLGASLTMSTGPSGKIPFDQAKEADFERALLNANVRKNGIRRVVQALSRGLRDRRIDNRADLLRFMSKTIGDANRAKAFVDQFDLPPGTAAPSPPRAASATSTPPRPIRAADLEHDFISFVYGIHVTAADFEAMRPSIEAALAEARGMGVGEATLIIENRVILVDLASVIVQTNSRYQILRRKQRDELARTMGLTTHDLEIVSNFGGVWRRTNPLEHANLLLSDAARPFLAAWARVANHIASQAPSEPRYAAFVTAARNFARANGMKLAYERITVDTLRHDLALQSYNDIASQAFFMGLYDDAVRMRRNAFREMVAWLSERESVVETQIRQMKHGNPASAIIAIKGLGHHNEHRRLWYSGYAAVGYAQPIDPVATASVLYTDRLRSGTPMSSEEEGSLIAESYFDGLLGEKLDPLFRDSYIRDLLMRRLFDGRHLTDGTRAGVRRVSLADLHDLLALIAPLGIYPPRRAMASEKLKMEQARAMARAWMTRQPFWLSEYTDLVNGTWAPASQIRSASFTRDEPPAGNFSMPQSWLGSWGGPLIYGVVMPLVEEGLRQVAGQLLPGGPLTIIVLYSVVHALLHVVVDVREGGWKLFLRRLPARVALSAAFGAASWYGPRLFELDAGAVVSIAGMEIPGLVPFLFGFGAHAFNNLVLAPFRLTLPMSAAPDDGKSPEDTTSSPRFPFIESNTEPVLRAAGAYTMDLLLNVYSVVMNLRYRFEGGRGLTRAAFVDALVRDILPAYITRAQAEAIARHFDLEDAAPASIVSSASTDRLFDLPAMATRAEAEAARYPASVFDVPSSVPTNRDPIYVVVAPHGAPDDFGPTARAFAWILRHALPTVRPPIRGVSVVMESGIDLGPFDKIMRDVSQAPLARIAAHFRMTDREASALMGVATQWLNASHWNKILLLTAGDAEGRSRPEIVSALAPLARFGNEAAARPQRLPKDGDTYSSRTYRFAATIGADLTAEPFSAETLIDGLVFRLYQELGDLSLAQGNAVAARDAKVRALTVLRRWMRARWESRAALLRRLRDDGRAALVMSGSAHEFEAFDFRADGLDLAAISTGVLGFSGFQNLALQPHLHLPAVAQVERLITDDAVYQLVREYVGSRLSAYGPVDTQRLSLISFCIVEGLPIRVPSPGDLPAVSVDLNAIAARLKAAHVPLDAHYKVSAGKIIFDWLRMDTARWRPEYDELVAGGIKVADIPLPAARLLTPLNEPDSEAQATRDTSVSFNGEPVTGPAQVQFTAGVPVVLHIEDDHHHRDTLRAVLAVLGYDVISAADGGSGLRALDRYRGHISAIVSDLDLPDIRGEEIYRRVRADHANDRIGFVFMTARPRSDLTARGLPPDVRIIPKPADVKVVRDQVKRAIEGKPEPVLLYIEDSVQYRRFMVPELIHAGFNVMVAGDGAEALAALDQNPAIGMVLSDIDLPDMTGADILKVIRGNSRFQNLPFVVLSSRPASHRAELGIPANVPWLVKNLNFRQLARSVVSAFNPPASAHFVLDPFARAWLIGKTWPRTIAYIALIMLGAALGETILFQKLIIPAAPGVGFPAIGTAILISAAVFSASHVVANWIARAVFRRRGFTAKQIDDLAPLLRWNGFRRYFRSGIFLGVVFSLMALGSGTAWAIAATTLVHALFQIPAAYSAWIHQVQGFGEHAPLSERLIPSIERLRQAAGGPAQRVVVIARRGRRLGIAAFNVLMTAGVLVAHALWIPSTRFTRRWVPAPPTVEFVSGAGQVSANCTVVRVAGKTVVIDAGIEVGSGQMPDYSTITTPPDAIVITHAHADHIGSLPVLHKKFPRVPIYASPATIRLMKTMLRQSLQSLRSHDIRQADITDTLRALLPLDTGTRYALGPKAWLELLPAGHIIGARSVEIGSLGGHVVLTGDIQTVPKITVGPAVPSINRPDILVSETTMGDRSSPDRSAEEEKLVRSIRETLARGGNAIIPSLALDRAQEVLLILRDAQERGDLPPDTIFFDGMINETNAAYQQLAHEMPAARREIMARNGGRLYAGPGVDIQSVDSIDRGSLFGRLAAERSRRPGIVIVAPAGMLNGGHIIDYLHAGLANPKNRVFFVNYQPTAGPGERILNASRGDSVRLEDHTVVIRADIEKISISGHADSNGLAGYIVRTRPRRGGLALVHGHPNATAALASRPEVARFRPVIPANGDRITARRPPLFRSLWRLVFSLFHRPVALPRPPDLRQPDNMLVFTRTIRPFSVAFAEDVHHDTGKFRAMFAHTALEPRLWGSDIQDRFSLGSESQTVDREQLQQMIRDAVAAFGAAGYDRIVAAVRELGRHGPFSAEDLAARVGRTTPLARLGAIIFLMTFPEIFEVHRGRYRLTGSLFDPREMKNHLHLQLNGVLGNVEPDVDEVEPGTIIMVDSQAGKTLAYVTGQHPDGDLAAYRLDKRFWAPRADKSQPRVEIPFRVGGNDGRLSKIVVELPELLSVDERESARRFRAFVHVAEDMLPGDARHLWMMIQAVSDADNLTIDEMADTLLTPEAERLFGLRARYAAFLAPRTTMAGSDDERASHNALQALVPDRVREAVQVAIALRLNTPPQYFSEDAVSGVITPTSRRNLAAEIHQDINEINHEIDVYALPLGSEVTVPAGTTVHLNNAVEPRYQLPQPTTAVLVGKYAKFVAIDLEIHGERRRTTVNIKRIRLQGEDGTPGHEGTHPVGVSWLFGALYRRSSRAGRAVIALLGSPVVESLLIGGIAAFFGIWTNSFPAASWLGFTATPLASGLFFMLIHPAVFEGLDGTPRPATADERWQLFFEGALYGLMFAVTGGGLDGWLGALITDILLHVILNVVSIVNGEMVSVAGGSPERETVPAAYVMSDDDRRASAGDEVDALTEIIETRPTARRVFMGHDRWSGYPAHNLLQELAAFIITDRLPLHRRNLRAWFDSADREAQGGPFFTPSERRRLVRELFSSPVRTTVEGLRRSAAGAILADQIGEAFERRDVPAFITFRERFERQLGGQVLLVSADERSEWLGQPILRPDGFDGFIDSVVSRIPAGFLTNRNDAAALLRTILSHSRHSHDRVALLLIQPEWPAAASVVGLGARQIASSVRLMSVNNNWLMSPGSRVQGDGYTRASSSYVGPALDVHGGMLRTSIRVVPGDNARPGYPDALLARFNGGSNATVEQRMDANGGTYVKKIAPAVESDQASAIPADEAREKLLGEAAVMRQLYDDGYRFLPRIDSITDDGEHVVVTMQDLEPQGYVPAAQFLFFDYFHHVPPEEIWNLGMRMLETLAEALYRRGESPTPPDFVMDRRVDYVRRRLAQAAAKSSAFSELVAEPVVIVRDFYFGIALPSFEAFVPFIEKILPYVTPPSLRGLMGDMHLGNALVSPFEFEALGRFESFFLVDFNARPNDYLYDLVKLIHSFYGQYELLRLHELYGYVGQAPQEVLGHSIPVFEAWFEDEEINATPLSVTADLTDIFIEWLRTTESFLGIETGSLWKARLLFTHAIAMLGLPPFHMESRRTGREATGMYLVGMSLLFEALDLIMNGAFDDGLPEGFPRVDAATRQVWNAFADSRLGRRPEDRPTSLATYRFPRSRIDQVRRALHSDDPRRAIDAIRLLDSVDMGRSKMQAYRLLGRYLSPNDMDLFIRTVLQATTKRNVRQHASDRGMNTAMDARTLPVRTDKPAFVGVTLSPVVDVTAPGGYFENPPEIHAGGKAINMVRSLKAWTGRDPVALGFAGGDAGSLLTALMEQDGVPSGLMTRTRQPTRLSLAMTNDRQTGPRFAGRGPAINAEMLGRFHRTFDDNVRPGDVVLLGGSLPTGVPGDEYAELIRRATAAGARTYVDARGTALVHALAAHPHFVGLNISELAGTLEVPLEALDHNRTAIAERAADWVRRGVDVVVVTMGPDGIVMAARDGDRIRAWHARAPKVSVVDTNGAGDTVKVAFAYAESEGRPLVDALRLAASASSVTVTKAGAAMSTLAEAEASIPQIEISEIPVPATSAAPVGVSVLLGPLYQRVGRTGRAVIALLGSPVIESLLIGALCGPWPFIFPGSPGVAVLASAILSGLFFMLIHPEVFDGLNDTPRRPSASERRDFFIEGVIYGLVFASLALQGAGWGAWLTAVSSDILLHAWVNLQNIRRHEPMSVAGGAGGNAIVARARRLLVGTPLSVDVESIDGRLTALERAAGSREHSVNRGNALLSFQRFVTGPAFAAETSAPAMDGLNIVMIDESESARLTEIVTRERAKADAGGTVLFLARTPALAGRVEAAIAGGTGAPAVALARPDLFTTVRGGATLSLVNLSRFLSSDVRFAKQSVARVVASDAVAFDAAGLDAVDPLRRALFVVLSSIGAVTLTIGQLDRLTTVATLVGRQA